MSLEATDLVDMASAEEKPDDRKLTSAEIKAGLRNAMSKGHQVFFEVGNDTGTRVTRHADAVAIGIWPSTGHQIHGFEIKVSRGDFLSEMKSPEKSWPVMRYCHRWSLLTPPGLVKVDELPPNWGLQTFDGRIMRTVKQAPLLKPEALSPGFVAALVRRAGDLDGELINAAVNKARLELRKEHETNLEAKLRNHARTLERNNEKAVKIVQCLKEELGEDYMDEFQAKEIAAAVKALRKSGIISTYGGVLRIASDLERSAAGIRSAMAELGLEPPHTTRER